VGLAEPAGGEIGDVDDGKALGMVGGEIVEDGAGRVGRAVVDSEDVEVGVDLGEKGLDRFADGPLLIACGNDDGDCGGAGGCLVEGDAGEDGQAAEAEG